MIHLTMANCKASARLNSVKNLSPVFPPHGPGVAEIIGDHLQQSEMASRAVTLLIQRARSILQYANIHKTEDDQRATTHLHGLAGSHKADGRKVFFEAKIQAFQAAGWPIVSVNTN